MLLVIVLAGELIFALPFHLARFFRPTFLQAFDLTNTQLGNIFAVYGVVAMLSYFPGGVIADKFAPNRLMSVSLFATALGGLYLYQGPGHTGLMILFGYWGATTILLFWAAMLKATRLSAEANQQGLAFGLLDGGRGLVASVFASIALMMLGTNLITATGDFSSQMDALQAMRPMILYYIGLTAIVAIVTYFGVVNVTDTSEQSAKANGEERSEGTIRDTLTNRLVWLQGAIVVCAYCGYKALDNYGLFVMQAFGWDQVEAARFTTYGSYLRPIVAITAGLLADKLTPSRLTTACFAVLVVLFALLAMAEQTHQLIWFVSLSLLITFVGVFALRAVYFALVEESQVRMGATGKAVGVISVVGFTPDIFFAPVTGRMLDSGETGFVWYFAFLAIVMVIGCACSWVLSRWIERQKNQR